MADERGSFWTSLPGVLTALAALITAIGGTYALIHKPASDAVPPPSVDAVSPAPASKTLDGATPTPAQSRGAEPATPPPASPSAVPFASTSAIATRIADPALAKSLGAPRGDETDAPGGGRQRDFADGSVYWHDGIGAFTVQGLIRDKFRDVGGTEWGYPKTDELPAPDGVGRFNYFTFVYPNGFVEERAIYWRPDLGTHAVIGQILVRWKATGWERGPLGYPTSDEYQAGAMRRQDFEHGRIDWTAAGGPQVTMR